MEPRIEMIREPRDDLAQTVNSFLRSYNEAANPIWWQKLQLPEHQPRPLNVFAFDGSEVIGGLIGETYLSWLKVHIMAIHPNRRGRGLGRQVLKAAESEAIASGCKYAFLDTMQYQAPDFYTQCGYEVAGRIADWDSHGHAKYFMTKPLACG